MEWCGISLIMTDVPSITVDPVSTMVGNQVSVSGKGFTANSKVEIKYDDIIVLPAQIEITQAGIFETKFNVPLNSTDGPHAVKAIVEGKNPVEVTLMVDDRMKMRTLGPLVAYYFSLLAISVYLLICHSQLPDWQKTIGHDKEIRFVLLAGLFGLMGSSIHGVSALTTFAATQKLTKSWGLWHFMHPPVGTTLAILVYFVVRAGLVTGPEELNYYGVAALGTLVGLSTSNTMSKLRAVLETLFGSTTEKKDVKPGDKNTGTNTTS